MVYAIVYLNVVSIFIAISQLHDETCLTGLLGVQMERVHHQLCLFYILNICGLRVTKHVSYPL